jgi:small conductance mechanosensitive channel
MNLLLAQAAPAVDTAARTNRAGGLLDPNHGLVARFEEVTGLPREVALWSVNIVGALVILVAGYMLAGFARSLLRNLFSRRNIEATIGGFVGNIAHALIMTFVVITVLGQLGVDTKSFAAIIAAAGLAIGLALQGGLSNFAAGFLIVVFRPFKAGDTINGGGIEGKVEEVQVFSTTLNTADNKRIIVPNSALIGGTITNYTTNPTRRVDLQLAVGAGQDLDKAHAALLALATADPRVLKEPAPAVGNVKLIDLGTQMELRCWCRTADFGGLGSDLIARAPQALADAGIKGPDRTVYYVERK